MAYPIAVFVSGGGSNLQSLIDRIGEGALEAEIRLVVSNKADAFGLTRAKDAGIPTLVLPHQGLDREAYDARLVTAVNGSGAMAVILAGFMRMLSPVFLNAFAGRILNIHPALLPSFPGVHGQRDAAEYGVRLAGCTVHFVDEIMDHGPVIIQAAVPAHPGEGGEVLGKRILALEHRIYPQAVQWFASGRLTVEGRFVRVAEADVPLADMDGTGPCLVSPPLERGF